jgi:hypothetical protein
MDWLSLNQAGLVAELGQVRAALERGEAGDPEETCSRLDTLCGAFSLSTFERKVLLMCAGVELDSSFARLLEPLRHPTFSVALNVFRDAHWSALSPDAPLRRWKLVEITATTSITTAPLRIDERTLHFLTGLDCIDEKLAPYAEDLHRTAPLAPSHRHIAERLAAFVLDEWEQGRAPLLHLFGRTPQEKRGIAGLIRELLQTRVYAVPASLLPIAPVELDSLVRLLEREAALTQSILYLDWESTDPEDSARAEVVARMVRQYRGVMILASRERRAGFGRMIHAVEVEPPAAEERAEIWRQVLEEDFHRFEKGLNAVLPQFALSAPSIAAAAGETRATRFGDAAENLWDACRKQARPRMEGSAQRIASSKGWDDIVLPAAQMNTLREIASQVRNRFIVYDHWKFGRGDERGMGISVLFSGPSGTGKTLAAEVLANSLRLDLYRVDLSQVVSKYIGETEKNLRRVFDAAEEGGAVLLFDEADAIFGKRSEVKDSHDRYANLEVSYLLQRMESYLGLAILTTNLKSAIDHAFHRRLRFIVQFSFPEAVQRADIWRRSFPEGAPVEGLRFDKLARLNIAGGNIRNAAIGAAFLAAEAGEPIRMKHLAQSCRAELAKLERPAGEAEFGDWV